MTWGIIEGRLPGLLPFAVGVACAVTYTAYALDKHAARRGRWRIPESTLHLLELLGGWPRALLAQHLLHHKTRKAAYRQAFWKMVVVNCAVLAGWILYWDRLPF
ncbi:DUF1294 domain-containing protein [Lysobacter solisilvae]|uniref:DUF1294 domain-containing protein n=2 Tax=Agrilutibacter solisilvae TaxID=2763317 RepID=A0A974Y1W8_9GAMM|nr:DUF1294 domain-containing protein [Lysobacter solisilvae]